MPDKMENRVKKNTSVFVGLTKHLGIGGSFRDLRSSFREAKPKKKHDFWEFFFQRGRGGGSSPFPILL